MPLFGSKKCNSSCEKKASGYPTQSAAAYPTQQQQPVAAGAAVGAYEPPPPYSAAAAPQQPGYPGYPAAGFIPVNYHQQVFGGPPQTVVVQGGFDAGARFDGMSRPNIPPPPPGCLPNAAQMAAAHGHNVVVTQQKSSVWTGGSDGGYTMF